MKSTNKVFFNTIVLYTQLLISVFVGFYTTRLVLQGLGEKNFGIYSLVAGVIGMMAFINSAMTTASMRFLTYSTGTNDLNTQRKTFNTALAIHMALGLLLIVFMEIGGFLMFKYFLNIPPENIFEAKIVFHFMVLSVFISIISVPFDAIISAHENMLAFSLINFSGVIFRLIIAIFLLSLNNNLLIIYALLTLVTEILLRIVKQFYSTIKYAECKIKIKMFFDKSLAKKMLSFSGWNLFGSLGAVAVTQLNGIMLNIFFGVFINAANGIAANVSSRVNNFSVSLNTAIFPQIMKSEGSGDRLRMLKLTMVSAKFSVYIFSFFALPIIIEAPYIFKLWLKNVPEFAIIFTRLILIEMLLSKFTFALTDAIRAVGKIRIFQVTETSIMLLVIPLTYVLFSLKYPPYAIFIIIIFITIITSAFRLYFAKIITGLDVRIYIINIFIRTSLPIIISVLLAIISQLVLPIGVLRLFVVFSTIFISLIISIRILGLNKYEYTKLYNLSTVLLQKFNK